MPAATVAPRKPAANPNGSQERKDDASVIVRPPVYERRNWPARGMHESFHLHAAPFPSAQDAIRHRGNMWRIRHPRPFCSGRPHPAAACARHSKATDCCEKSGQETRSDGWGARPGEWRHRSTKPRPWTIARAFVKSQGRKPVLVLRCANRESSDTTQRSPRPWTIAQKLKPRQSRGQR